MIAISAVLVVGCGTILWLMLRSGWITWSGAINCMLLGFALATTSLAPHISNGIGSVAHWLGSIF